MKPLMLCLALLLPAPSAAETVVATRTIRAQSVLTPADVTLADSGGQGAYSALEDVLGLEARVAIYAGRPILSGEIGPPAVIERNQIVPLVYRAGGLAILAEGRALGRAGVGERVRVMNSGSRQTVSGQVAPDGSVFVVPSTSMLDAN